MRASRLVLVAVLLALLLAAPAQAVDPSQPLVGAKVSRTTTERTGTGVQGGVYVVPAVRFDVVRFERGGDFWDASQPSRLTFPVSGCYAIGAQVTALGTGYGGPSSADLIITVRRNGNPNDYVAGNRVDNQWPTSATLVEADTVECFTGGDYVELKIEPNVLVESNWPGSGGSLSPVLWAVLLGT